ncbi:MAG TPA: hypothetical protein ENJ09_13140 [Planctomycetes bacterium]|nr:hypothetical protein [Planctomycetota bacterium]
MIDLTGIPLPDDAPEPGTTWRLELLGEGLAHLVLDPLHRPKLAVFDAAVLRDLDEVLDEIERAGDIRALVITGRSPTSFAAGADVETIARIEDPAIAERFVRGGQRLFQRLHRLGREGGGRIRTVAAVGGPVPGGACEISLACDRIVLADDETTKIGLPEVLLGIYPAWGGSQRLPRRIGVPAALASILGGTLHRPRKALRLGLVDRLTKPAYLLRVADDVATGRVKLARRGRKGWERILIDQNPIAGALIARTARKGVMAKTHGHYPAPLAVLPLVVAAPRTELDVGLEDEVRGVLPLSSSPIAHNLVRIFLDSEAAKKLGREDGEDTTDDISRAAVIGAGVMGGGIASLMAQKGLEVRLRDLDRSQLDHAVETHRASVERKRKRRRLTRSRADAAIDRLEVTTEAIGFGRCTLAIEAVAERLEVKRVVLAEMAGLLPEGAILATNTSSLSVGEIAEGIPGPERVVGMHFFNPVARMPLVEIVRGPATSDDAVARVARLAVRLGKTPIIVRDVAGFLVNRLLGPYLDEALRMVDAGADPREIDVVLEDFGMPMGPCELIDEVGLDIASHAGASLSKAYGERMAATQVLEPLVEAGELGKKTGRGLYLWEKGKDGKPRRAGRNPRLGDRGGPGLSSSEIVDRCVLALVAEAMRALEEEVVAGPRELDLGVIFGTGFAPFRGGPLRYADARGLREIAARLEALASNTNVQVPARFGVPGLLREMLEKGSTFHGNSVEHPAS